MIIIKNDNKINIEFIPTKNKNTYLYVRKESVVVKLGRYANKTEIASYINKRFDYFLNKINKYNLFHDENSFILFGKKLAKKVIISNKDSYEIFPNNIIIFIKDINKLKKYENEIYKQELNNFLNLKKMEIINTISKLNLKLVPTILKPYKSRWGACYKNPAKISLNIYLAKLDYELIMLVIYHEYTHFLVQGHSQKFYEKLEKMMPNCIKLSNKLNKLNMLI